MHTEIRNLEPSEVWTNFCNLNEVPRPSKKEERIIEFMLAFGRSLGLESFRDPVGNVLIRKPASEGMENRVPVVLQSHLDMVHQKNSETDFDFEEEGIRMYADGDWVRAKGTTLGADNGMGVAAMMAILASENLAHPPLEALFTIDEETGMTGAKGLEPGLLQGEILLNLDTEEDDEIDIGCAGGLDLTATASYTPEIVPAESLAYAITISGLQGGHSGMDIHRGLGNANKIMNHLLQKGSDTLSLRIGQIEGGGLRNAIPRESRSIVYVPGSEARVWESKFEEWAALEVERHKKTEPGLKINFQRVEGKEGVLPEIVQDQFLEAIEKAHNGVYKMSDEFEGLVEASNNIARVEVKDGSIIVGCLLRSSLESSKMELAENLASIFRTAGHQVEFSGEYPGWAPNPDSKIVDLVRSRYKDLFGEEPRVVACHAGLECGILGATYPRMDMVSFGPTIRGAHSPDERVQISSVGKFWTLLLDTLAQVPTRD